MPISKEDINEIRFDWAQEGRFDAAYWMPEIIATLERAVKLEAVAEAALEDRAAADDSDYAHEHLVGIAFNVAHDKAITRVLKAQKMMKEALAALESP